jgi:hypothetical protein
MEKKTQYFEGRRGAQFRNRRYKKSWHRKGLDVFEPRRVYSRAIQGKFSPAYILWRHTGGVQLLLHRFWISEIEESGQLQAPFVSALGMNLGTHWRGGWLGPRAGLDGVAAAAPAVQPEDGGRSIHLNFVGILARDDGQRPECRSPLWLGRFGCRCVGSEPHCAVLGIEVQANWYIQAWTSAVLCGSR